MKIKDLPEQNRPRERFLKHGPEALSDSELFAIFLRTGTPDENVMDMSNRLLNEYSLDKLFDCSLKELQEISGIGQTKAMQILAMAELGKRQSQSKKPVTKISCARDVFDYFKDGLKEKKEEHLYVLMLNAQNNIIGKHLISKGILDSVIVHPREVFRPAIKNNASKIVIVHNHPSGDPNPSEEDLDINRKLLRASEDLGIKMVDSLIISGNKYFSWGENRKD